MRGDIVYMNKNAEIVKQKIDDMCNHYNEAYTHVSSEMNRYKNLYEKRTEQFISLYHDKQVITEMNEWLKTWDEKHPEWNVKQNRDDNV